MRVHAAFALASCLLATSCQTSATTAQASLPAPQSLDASLLVGVERSRVPGLVGAVFRNGEIVELFATGGSDCVGQGAADPSFAYEIGSISKHIVAVAIMQMVEQRRVELDAPVGRYLDDIPEAWRAVTLRQLLTHTSGVPDYEAVGSGYAIYETSPTPADVYALVADRPLDFEPGARWSYSNTGYFLLSLVVQQVSGERFGDYLREHLFEPAGAHNMFMAGYAPGGVRIAQGCKPGGAPGAPRVPAAPISEASTFGAGGVLTTLESWGRWEHALFSGRIISPQSLALILTPATINDGTTTGYGFGVEVTEYRGQRWYGHSGQTQGFTASYQRFPDQGVSVLTMGNAYGGNPSAFGESLVLRSLPDLSYDQLVAMPEPEIGPQIRQAVRQVILVEEPLDLLHPDMQQFARNPQAAPQRARLHDYVVNAQRIEFVQQTTLSQQAERYLYRYILDGETHYFSAVWREGVLFRLRYEER